MVAFQQRTENEQHNLRHLTYMIQVETSPADVQGYSPHACKDRREYIPANKKVSDFTNLVCVATERWALHPCAVVSSEAALCCAVQCNVHIHGFSHRNVGCWHKSGRCLCDAN